jgi:RimJ/RimL family protein N-acetyltransferase
VDAWQDWPDYDDPLLVGTSPRRMGHEQRTRWFDDLLQRQRQIPFAVDDERGQMIGRLFLRHVQPVEASAVLGIDFHPAKLSQRYGTESMVVFLPYFFGPLGFRRMLLSVAAHNERAQRCYEGLGFRVIGSHWDAHPGPDIMRDSRYIAIHHLFRRGMLGVESLYYDMQLDRAQWQARSRDVR